MHYQKAHSILRLAKGARSFARVVQDPNRLDEVFRLADQIADPEDLRDVVAGLARDPQVATALRERPRLGRVDLNELARLPHGTLGRIYADHMTTNGLDPNALPTRPSPDELSYVLAHVYETHDVWHVVTGFGTDVVGELGLQAFYVAQMPGRISVAIVSAILLNTILSRPAFGERDARMWSVARGWLLGARARPLFGVDWGRLWSTPVDEIRTRYGVAIAETDALLEAHRRKGSV